MYLGNPLKLVAVRTIQLKNYLHAVRGYNKIHIKMVDSFGMFSQKKLIPNLHD